MMNHSSLNSLDKWTKLRLDTGIESE